MYEWVLFLQEEEVEDEEPGKPEEYGGAPSVRTRATRRGGTTRTGRTTTRRGITRLRQTQRKSRNTVRSTHGSQRLAEEGGIALSEIHAMAST